MVKQINFEFNVLFAPVFRTKARYIDLWGGRARGGSHFGTDYFLFLLTQPKYFRGCFLRAIFGDIRGSLWQDFKDRMEALVLTGDLNRSDFALNESLMTVTYKPTGNSIISKGFKKSSGSQSAKLKSLAGMTHVLIEECEEVDEDDFNKLDDSLRTTKVENIQILRLFNPPSKNHWLIKRFYNLIPCGLKDKNGLPLTWYKAIPKAISNFLSVHSTFKDNIQNLNDSTISKYLAYGDENSPSYNEDFYYRDVLGLVSEGKKGRILKNCFPITYEEFRALPYPSFAGLDFGYAIDPVALVEMKKHNNIAYWHRLIYQPGLTDDELAEKMRAAGVDKKLLIYADSAEPKSIATLKKKGFNIIGAKKGQDSLLFGIKHLQSLKHFITETSEEIWTEIEEYSWELDSSKNPTDTPIDDFNHAIDAGRYALTSHQTSRLVVSDSGAGSILDLL
jgi:phage terminase large subunit